MTIEHKQTMDYRDVSYRMVRPTVTAALATLEGLSDADPQVRKAARRAAYLAAAILYSEECTERMVAASYRELSRTDPVTGLDNRQGYDTNVRESFLQALARVQPLTVVTLDLNNIDVVNVEQGRTEGDRWIKTTAEILRDSSPRRPARWGGDEYGVVLDNADTATAYYWWDSVRPQFDAAGIHISGGAATYYPTSENPGTDTAIDQTHAYADTALYIAKVLAKQQDTNVLMTCVLDDQVAL